MTDEMIARYLSGKATPEEESAVLDYMSENDERVEDLLAMSAAVEQYKETRQRQKVRSIWPVFSAVASVILLLGFGITLWHTSQSDSEMNIEHAPAYAEQDSVTVMDMEDAL